MDQLGFERKVPGAAWDPDQDLWKKLHGAPGIGRYFGIAASESAQRAYEQMDKQVRTSQRAYYENDEYRRLGKSASAPGNTVTIDGVPYEIPPELRLRILEMETSMKEAALDALTVSPEFLAMTDIERSKEIDREFGKIRDVVRDNVLSEMPELSAARLAGKAVPPGVQKQYEAYTAIPGYTAMMWDGRINAPRYITITDAQASRIQQAQQEIALIKDVAPRKITDKQAIILYALLTNDIEGAIMSLVQVRKNPERDRYWDAHPLLDEYYDKSVPISDPTDYWQSLLPEMARVPSAQPTERVPARSWAEVAA